MNKQIIENINTIYTIFKLVINEIIKVGIIKIIISLITFLITILIIYKTNKSDILNTSYSLIPFVGIFMIIFYGGSISSEIESGSLKYYLTKPIKRWKIYLSKLISIYLYLVIVFAYIIFIYLIIIDKIDTSFIIKFIKYTIPIFLMGTISLFLSSFIKNTAFCIGIDIFILVFSTMFSQVLFGLSINIVEYTFLPYLDFSIFNDLKALDIMNNELEIHLSLSRGIKIDLIFIFIFYYLGNLIFTNKDVKN
jgi:ABC-type transport system involved in multi-copper enzyme maturation permease subunit